MVVAWERRWPLDSFGSRALFGGAKSRPIIYKNNKTEIVLRLCEVAWVISSLIFRATKRQGTNKTLEDDFIAVGRKFLLAASVIFSLIVPRL